MSARGPAARPWECADDLGKPHGRAGLEAGSNRHARAGTSRARAVVVVGMQLEHDGQEGPGFEPAAERLGEPGELAGVGLEVAGDPRWSRAVELGRARSCGDGARPRARPGRPGSPAPRVVRSRPCRMVHARGGLARIVRSSSRVTAARGEPGADVDDAVGWQLRGRQVPGGFLGQSDVIA